MKAPYTARLVSSLALNAAIHEFHTVVFPRHHPHTIVILTSSAPTPPDSRTPWRPARRSMYVCRPIQLPIRPAPAAPLSAHAPDHKPHTPGSRRTCTRAARPDRAWVRAPARWSASGTAPDRTSGDGRPTPTTKRVAATSWTCDRVGRRSFCGPGVWVCR